jgi:uncharacterized protein (TIGR02996 family)
MRTFELRDAKSHKFWNIDLQGNQFTVAYGRVGSAGQTQTKQFDDADKARKEHDKLVREKLAKGYVETTAGAAAVPTHKALENAVAADPDDRGAHAAYADALMEQGDPRGEFISVQLALEDASRPTPERKKLQKREQALIEEHGRAWLGELAPYLLDVSGDVQGRYATYPAIRFQFARGWLDTLEVGLLSVPFARVLARAPQTRLLRRLVIKETRSGDDEAEEERYEPGPDVPEGAYWPGLFPLVKSPHLGNVRVLQLGEQVQDWPFEMCAMSGEGAAALVGKLPRLEELYWFAHGGRDDLQTLFALKTLSRLRILQVYHVEDEYPLAALARNPALGRLTHLLLHPHGYSGSQRGSYLPAEEVRALVRSPHLQSLTHVRLRMSNLGDPGCADIVRSGMLKHLKVLDLREGAVTDEGARTLAACPDLPRLELLDLRENALTEDGIAALRAAGVRVEADAQHGVEDDGYLMDGDME